MSIHVYTSLALQMRLPERVSMKQQVHDRGTERTEHIAKHMRLERSVR